MQFANKISLWILITFIDYCSRLSFKGRPNQKEREHQLHHAPPLRNFAACQPTLMVFSPS